MSKSVLVSIRPKWCKEIACGAKNVEIRKTRPAKKTPFKVYIYRTMPNFWNREPGDGMVIGEFNCDRIEYLDMDSVGLGFWKDNDFIYLKDIGWNTKVSRQNLLRYSKGERVYGWHISDLVIYDKPRELSEFYCRKQLFHPPMSWCYVEEMK